MSNHIELGLQESKQATGPHAFSIWCEKVLEIVGISSLDGDQVENGYSTDKAYYYFSKGLAADIYAAELLENRDVLVDTIGNYDSRSI